MNLESIEEPLKDHMGSTEDENPLVRIGFCLKQAREKKSISTEELAESLRIGEEQLTALENGQEELLPEYVFIKAMVRRVAEKLNLDPITIVQELDENQIISKFQKEKNNSLAKDRKEFLIVKYIRKISPKSLLLGFTTIIILSTGLFYIIYKQRSNNLKNTDTVIPQISLDIKDNLPKKLNDLQITSKRPTKIIIIDSGGEILFKGKLKGSINLNSGKGLEVYSERPDLIELTTRDNKSYKLGSINDVRWHFISNTEK